MTGAWRARNRRRKPLPVLEVELALIVPPALPADRRPRSSKLQAASYKLQASSTLHPPSPSSPAYNPLRPPPTGWRGRGPCILSSAQSLLCQAPAQASWVPVLFLPCRPQRRPACALSCRTPPPLLPSHPQHSTCAASVSLVSALRSSAQSPSHRAVP